MSANLRNSHSESGQMLVLMAMGVFLVLIGAAAISIDLGNGELQKRRLQNITDAAAMAAAAELSQGGTEPKAFKAAQDIVTGNTGGALSLPISMAGLGASLTHGIEIEGSEVRVALTNQVSTWFAGVLGQDSMTIVARSRTTSTWKNAVLPIAIKRFSAGDTSEPLSLAPPPVFDYVAPAKQDVVNTTNWPTLTDKAQTFDHRNEASSVSGNPEPPELTPWNAWSPESGRVMAVLGGDAAPNTASSTDFHFWVAPDVRNLTPGPPEFYNFISETTSVQTLKDLSMKYILEKGYTGEPPEAGDQLATLNGVDTNMAVDAMRKAFKRGEIFTAFVYDGTVYRKPDFSLDVTEPYREIKAGIEGEFELTIRPTNTFSGSVILRPIMLNTWANWQFEDSSGADIGSANGTPAITVSSGTNIVVRLRVTPHASISPEQVKTAFIAAYDQGTTQITRIANIMVGVGIGDPVDYPDTFSVSINEAYAAVEQGSKVEYSFDLKSQQGFNGTVQIGPAVNWTGYNPEAGTFTGWSSTPPVGLSFAPKNPAQKNVKAPNVDTLKAELVATSSAAISLGTGGYIIEVPVENTSGVLVHKVYLYFRVLPAQQGITVSGTSSFVRVLGYADFVMCYGNDVAGVVPAGDGNITTENNSMDANTIYAYAISDLYNPITEGSNKQIGMKPRLVPWQ